MRTADDKIEPIIRELGLWFNDKGLDNREVVAVLSSVAFAVANQMEGLPIATETDPTTVALVDKVLAGPLSDVARWTTAVKALAVCLHLITLPEQSNT